MKMWPGKQAESQRGADVPPEVPSQEQSHPNDRGAPSKSVPSDREPDLSALIASLQTAFDRSIDSLTKAVDARLLEFHQQLTTAAPRRGESDGVQTFTHQVECQFEKQRSVIEVLQNDVSQMRETIELQPRKLRELGQKIDQVTSAITDGRYGQLVNQLIDFEDLLGRAEREWSASHLAETGDRLLSALRAELRQILELNAVTEVVAEQGMSFEPSQHRCVDTVLTPNAASDGKIDRVIRVGFRAPNRVLRHPDVVVLKFSSQPAEPLAAEALPRGSDQGVA